MTARIREENSAIAIIVAIGIGIVAAIWAYLHVSYHDGVYTAWAGRETFERLGRRLTQPAGADTAVIGAVSVGTLVAGLLAFLRGRWMWFPFHAARLCCHQHLHDELLLVLAARQFRAEVGDYQARRHRRLSEGSTVFPRASAWRVCGDDILGDGGNCVRVGDVYYD